MPAIDNSSSIYLVAAGNPTVESDQALSVEEQQLVIQALRSARIKVGYISQPSLAHAAVRYIDFREFVRLANRPVQDPGNPNDNHPYIGSVPGQYSIAGDTADYHYVQPEAAADPLQSARLSSLELFFAVPVLQVALDSVYGPHRKPGQAPAPTVPVSGTYQISMGDTGYSGSFDADMVLQDGD